VFQTRIAGRACENFGAVDYTITDTISEVGTAGGGVVVTARTLGICEGERVDQQEVKHWPGVTLESAAAYRLRSGWTEIAGPPRCSHPLADSTCDGKSHNHPTDLDHRPGQPWD